MMSDLVETSGSLLDQDGNGVVDNFADADKDGIDDIAYISPSAALDNDADNRYDAIDVDADGDGISDLFEAGGVDVNDDGLVDGFLDDDLDGLDDGVTVLPLPVINSDDDSFADFQDTDSDNDGVSDLVESGGIDADGDGFADTLTKSSTLLDSDGDGILDHLQNNLDVPVDPVAPVVPGAPLAANSGEIRTGLAGNGCSIGSAKVIDPLFALMILLSLISIVRIHRHTRHDVD